MHHLEPSFGKFASNYISIIRYIADEIETKELLDYGCGKRVVRKHLWPQGFTVHEYDPAIPGLDARPDPCGFVVCVDVLEHIEPKYFIAVLKDLRRVTARCGFFTFATKPALKTLPDGSNPHKIVQPKEWWYHTLSEFFELAPIVEMRDGHYYVRVAPRAGPVG